MRKEDRKHTVEGIPALIGRVTTDMAFCERFLGDPTGVATEFGLSDVELASLENLDIGKLRQALSGVAQLIPSDLVAGHSSVHSSVTDIPALGGLRR